MAWLMMFVSVVKPVVNSELAIALKAGTLQGQVTSAEEAYGYRKQTGVAVLINL